MMLQVLHQSKVLDAKFYCLTIGKRLIQHMHRFMKRSQFVDPVFYDIDGSEIIHEISRDTTKLPSQGLKSEAVIKTESIDKTSTEKSKLSNESIKDKDSTALLDFADIVLQQMDKPQEKRVKLNRDKSSSIVTDSDCIGNDVIASSVSGNKSPISSSLSSISASSVSSNLSDGNSNLINSVYSIPSVLYISQLTLEQIICIIDLNRPLPWDSVAKRTAYVRDSSYDLCTLI